MPKWWLVGGALLMTSHYAWADGLSINGGTVTLANSAQIDIQGDINVSSGALVSNASTISLSGDWVVAGSGFTAGTGTVTFDGTSSKTLDAGSSSFYNLTLSKTASGDANDNVTVINNALSVSGTVDISDGELIQGSTNFALNTLTLSASGKYSNSSSGDLTLSGDVSNAGVMVFDAGGGGSSTDSILIRSSSSGTQRNWQGSGTFTMTDVDVRDQTVIGGTPALISVSSGTDSGNNVNWFFGAGVLSSVNVEPALLAVGAEGDVTVNFTVQNTFPANGKVVIDFGSGFNATGLATVTNLVGINGGWSVSVANGDGTNDVVTLTRDGTGSAVLGSTAVSILLEDEIRNPLTPGSTGSYLVTTRQNDGTIIDSGAASADTITSSALSGISIAPASLTVGALGNHTLTFTATSGIPADGKIRITYPEGFDLSQLTTVSSSDVNGTLSISISGQIVTITRSGGTALSPGTAIDDFILGTIRNPVSPGNSGAFPISTLTSGNTTIDSGSASGVILEASSDLILLTLSASPQRVKVGDVVTLTSVLTNKTSSALESFRYVPELSGGMIYKPSSATVNSGTFTPDFGGQPGVLGDMSALGSGESRTVTFQAIVSSSVESGNLPISAYVQINPIISNVSQVTLQVVPDFVFTIGTLIGKVFWDKNGDGFQQKGEPGIPDVRVATEQGIVATTDAYGRYHIPDVMPGRHLVKADLSSIPGKAALTTSDSVLVHTTDAMLNKANFGVRLDEASASGLFSENSQEPISVQITQSAQMVSPWMGVDFDSLSINPDAFFLQSGKVGSLNIPLNVRTNFPGFIKRWKVSIYENTYAPKNMMMGPLMDLKRKKNKHKRLLLGKTESTGKPPALVRVNVSKSKILNPSHPLEVEFSAYDDQGKVNTIVCGLSTEHHPQGWLLSLSTPVMTDSEMNIQGASISIQGKSPLTNRIEVFGNQVPVEKDGSYRIELAMPGGDHEIPIAVYPGGFDPVSGKIIEVKPIYLKRSYKTRDSYLFHVGMGDLEMGHLTANGNRNSLTRKDRDRLEKFLYSDHRFAYYLKGKYRGRYRLTASIDTEREQTKFFRNLEPEDYYATYGDDSRVEYDAADTQDELFVMLEADKSYFRYGNYGTGFTGTEFSDFERTLHGLKLHYESMSPGFDQQAKTTATIFGAKAGQLAAHTEWRATGGSLYYAKHKRIIEGSEKVRVEIRDALTGIVLSQVPLTAGRDYDMDYDQGRIRLYRPLTVFSYTDSALLSSELLRGNSQYLTADYEYEDLSGRIQDKTGGVRLSHEVAPGLRLGGTYVGDRRAAEDYHMTGVDGAYQFFDFLGIRGEYAKSDLESVRQYVSADGGLSFNQARTAGPGTNGSGYKVESEVRPWNGMNLVGYYRWMDRDFSSTNSISQAGLQKLGMTAEQLVGEWGRVSIEHHEQDLIDGGTIASSSNGVNGFKTTQMNTSGRWKKWTNLIGYRHAEIDGGVVSAVPGFGIQIEDEDLVGTEFRYALTPKTELNAGVQTNLTGEANNQLRTGVSHKISGNSTLFATHVVGSRGNGLFAGLEDRLLGSKALLLSPSLLGATAQGAPSLGSSLFSPVGLGPNAGQEGTFGVLRKLGHGTEFGAAQSLESGGGRQRLLLSRTTKNQTYGIVQERSSVEEMTSIYQEKRLNRNVTLYSNSSNLKNRLDARAVQTYVKGAKASFFRDRLSLYQENQDSVYRESQLNASRSGSKFFLTPDLGIDLSYEQGKSKALQVDTAHQAVRSALSYFKYGRANIAGDFEYVKTSSLQSQKQFLSTGKGEFIITPEWRLLGRWEWSKTNGVAQSSDPFHRAGYSERQVGLAYRPTQTDWLNLLAEYKVTDDKSPLSQDNIDLFSHEKSRIYRGEVAFDINPLFLTLTEKGALRRARNLSINPGSSENDSTAFLWGNRFDFHLFQRIDFSLEHRTLWQSRAQDAKQGFLAEITARIMNGLRFGIGYNLTHYETKLARSFNVESSGFFARMIYEPFTFAEDFERKRPALFNGVSDSLRQFFQRFKF